MPKCTLDPFDKKKKELRAWIDGGIALVGIRSHAELARRIGISPSTFCRRYKHPEELTKAEEWAIEKVIGKKEAIQR